GMALGIASTFGSIGQCAALPYTHIIIEQYGWSQALLILAACSLVIVPLAFGLINKTARSTDDGNQPPASTSHTMMQALAEARQSPSFWLLNAGFFVCGFQVVFIAVHLPSYLTDKGFTMLFATVALTLIGLGNIIGSFFCGVLGDIYSRKYLLSGLYLLRSIIIAAFILTPVSGTSIIIFSLAIGLLWLGTVPLTSGLVAQIYGTTYMSTLFGIVFFSHQLGSFFGSWLAGRLFDITGSYDVMWWAAIGFGIISALLHWPISEQPIERPLKHLNTAT
ncbi:MAG: MFS transporter, partial [Methyloligellaceae bacterium]